MLDSGASPRRGPRRASERRSETTIFRTGGNFTCGNCQLLCHPDKDERKRRYELLTESGVVIQHADGSLEAVAPKLAEKYVSELPDEQRAMYEKV